MKIQAAIFRAPKQALTIEEVEIDDPAPREVLVRTVASGVCHSDLHDVHGLLPLKPPAILGHEPAGIVEAVGSDVTSVQPGDHVIACTSLYCGNCAQCLSGRPHLCANRADCQRAVGERPRLSQKGTPIHQFVDLAAFAEKMLLHERAVSKVADDIPLDRGALLGCAVTTGVGAALNTAQVAPGSTVAVFGAGGVGLSVIQGARIAGARQIIAVDLLDNKLEMAKHFGATHTVNASSSDAVREIKRLSEGGVDYSFEALSATGRWRSNSVPLPGASRHRHAGRGYSGGTKGRAQRRPLLRRKRGSRAAHNMGSNRFRLDMPKYLNSSAGPLEP